MDYTDEAFKITVVCNDKGYPHIPGEYTQCGKCGVQVYLSVSTVKNVEAQGYFKADILPMCFSCGRTELIGLKKEQILSLSEEQKKQVDIGIKKYGWGNEV